MNAEQFCIPLKISNNTGKKRLVRLFHNEAISDGVTIQCLYDTTSYRDVAMYMLAKKLDVTSIRFMRDRTFNRSPLSVKYQRVTAFGQAFGWEGKVRIKKGQLLENIVEHDVEWEFDGFASLAFEVDAGDTTLYLIKK